MMKLAMPGTLATLSLTPTLSRKRGERSEGGAAGQTNRYASLGLTLALFLLLCGSGAAHAVDFVSVAEDSAILYDAPSLKAKKLFIVNRYMPFEQVVVLSDWIKVRDRSGGLYWVEKKSLSNMRYVFALSPLLDVRSAADFSSPIVFRVRQQVALERLEATGTGWVKVRHLDGEGGYVRSTEIWGE